jgi:hypothetical protein
MSVGRRPAESVAARADDPVAETGPSAQGQEWHGGRLMIRQEPNAPGHAHVIGSLTGDTVHLLLEAVSSGVCVFDLSEVNQVDHVGVRTLARLWLERCTLVGCPRWLELWLARSRRNGG